MSYDFSFDKKSAFLIVGGCVVIGILLFFAGFIVGWDRSAYQAQRQLAKDNASRPATISPFLQAAQDKTGNRELSKSPPDSGQEKPLSTQLAKPIPLTSPSAASQAASNQEDSAASSDTSAFSLQFGAFQSQENAARLRTALKTKGYSVFVFDTLDAGGHVWHAVRMGHFPDLQKASAAAAVFAKKEKIPVSVRPGNEL
jgi:cell division septation protein DedD